MIAKDSQAAEAIGRKVEWIKAVPSKETIAVPSNENYRSTRADDIDILEIPDEATVDGGIRDYSGAYTPSPEIVDVLTSVLDSRLRPMADSGDVLVYENVKNLLSGPARQKAHLAGTTMPPGAQNAVAILHRGDSLVEADFARLTLVEDIPPTARALCGVYGGFHLPCREDRYNDSRLTRKSFTSA